MATTSGSSVSAQYRKGGKSGAGSDGERREGGRGPGRTAVFAGNVKRKWRPNQEQKKFEGSAKEGRGFALWRKNKVQSDYKKFQRKQKTNPKEVSYSDHYPEHLKHLYLAEEEKLKREEQQRRSAKKTSEAVDEQTEEKEAVVVIPKKKFKKTSSQKAKEEYERVQLKRAKKKEEAENNKRKREEALRLHKQRRMETFKVLCSKTKRGQPNFNVQMDHLLKKIQSKS